MSVEFRPNIKNVTIANDKVKIVLEVDKREVKNKLGDIAELEGKDITALLRQEAYEYTVPFDKSTDAPGIRYEVAPDGLVQKIVEEQMQLDLDQKSEDIENRIFAVERDTIDDFIIACPALEFPGKINPKDTIDCLRQGDTWKDIADRYEMSETALIDELERARDYYAPYADKWAQKREKEGFEFSRSAATKGEDDTKTDENDTEGEEKSTETADNDTEAEEKSAGSEDSSVDVSDDAEKEGNETGESDAPY